jgi:hypothetical protein
VLGNNLSLGEPRDITKPGDDAIHVELPFTVTPLDSPGGTAPTPHKLSIHFSRSRFASWGLTDQQAKAVMLSLALTHLLQVLRERQPRAVEELHINTATFPGPCPVSPADVAQLPREPIEVERAKKPIGF